MNNPAFAREPAVDQDAAAAANTITCHQCRAAFSIPALAAEVTCPYCAHRQPVAEHAELLDYQRDVARRAAATDGQHQIAASIEAWNASAASNPARNLAVVYGLMLGVPLALAGILGAVHLFGLLPATGPGPALAIGAASYGGLIGWLIWRQLGRGRAARKRTALRQTRVACPNCGAPGALTPGTAIDSCLFCDAALVPTMPQRSHGLDAARQAHRAAAIERRRAQRIAVVRATDLGPFALLMPVMIIGSLVLMLGGTAVGFTVQMLRGVEPFHPGIFFAWGLTVAVIGSVAVYAQRRRERRETLRAAVSDVAHQLGGSLLAGPRARVDWLNGFWGAEYDQQHIVGRTHLTCSATADLGGYPALIDIELNASRPAPRINLFVGAWVPELIDSDRASEKLEDRAMSELGFSVRKTEAGLVARANQALLEAARRDPDVVHVVTPALTRLANLAAERGYAPVT